MGRVQKQPAGRRAVSLAYYYLGGPSSAGTSLYQRAGQLAIAECYPSPFSSALTVRLRLPTAWSVLLRVYNALGQEVGTILNERLPAGEVERRWDPRGTPGGVYLLRLESEHVVETRKVVLQR